jgi:hypothetical protein
MNRNGVAAFFAYALNSSLFAPYSSLKRNYGEDQAY